MIDFRWGKCGLLGSICLSLPSCIDYCKKPMHLAEAHAAIVDYYERGCFTKELQQTISEAKELFSARASHNKQIVIFDVDETVLSDYCSVKSIQFGYIPKLSHEWVLSASAVAIPEVKGLYLYLIAQGYDIVFLTGRKHNEYEATLRNLLSEGYKEFVKLIVRPESMSQVSASEYKQQMRRELTREGYEIVGSVGDQQSDLTGDFVGIPIKIPNYLYRIS